jgi:hypothetical protein
MQLYQIALDKKCGKERARLTEFSSTNAQTQYEQFC